MSVFILLSRRRGFRCTQTRIGGGHRRDRGFQLSTTSMLEKFKFFMNIFSYFNCFSNCTKRVASYLRYRTIQEPRDINNIICYLCL